MGGEPTLGAHVVGASPVPVQMRQGEPNPRADAARVSPVPCRIGGEPTLGADVVGASPVRVQMWHGRAQSQCRFSGVRPSPGADIAGRARVDAYIGGLSVRRPASVANANRRRDFDRHDHVVQHLHLAGLFAYLRSRKSSSRAKPRTEGRRRSWLLAPRGPGPSLQQGRAHTQCPQSRSPAESAKAR
jgi:hypothetical protein